MTEFRGLDRYVPLEWTWSRLQGLCVSGRQAAV